MSTKGSVKYFMALFCFCLVCAGFMSADSGKVSPLLEDRITAAEASDVHKVWIYFTEKTESSFGLRSVADRFSDRALTRRAVIPMDNLDLPVNPDFVQAIKDAGGTNVRASRWLNAVSAELTSENITQISEFPFIRQIDIVKTYTRRPEPVSAYKPTLIPPPDAADYGSSFTQNAMLNADSAHSLGLDGTGVLIAFLDSGYDTAHIAFDSMDIVATYDFIYNDSDVTDAFPISSETNHGTATLSACGGYDPGFLIGTAYGASYLLAKTEDVSAEYQTEEDNWVFAMEWADSAGADIISSSLGYINWYTNADMDGNTATTTIAADIAASRGILVVTSAGNEGNDTWHIISAPADADSIIAVGAVDVSLNPTSFTSYGPTADGRMKPEVSALGSATYCANDAGGYYVKSGTSLSAPLIAGCAALIMQANPSLKGNPMAVRQRLMEAGHLYPTPDPNYRLGFGVPDVVKAAQTLQITPIPIVYITPGEDTTITVTASSTDGLPITMTAPDLPASYSFVDNGDGTADIHISGDISQEGTREFTIIATSGALSAEETLTIVTITDEFKLFVGPNPFADNLTIRLEKAAFSAYEIRIYTLSGEKVFQSTATTPVFSWPGINQNSEKVASGVYIIFVSADGIEEKVKVFKL
ncbi:MAG: S8 family serine peptidase [Candidatus Zixiibacteriota bacterium]